LYPYPREERAGLVLTFTDFDDTINSRLEEFIHTFGPLSGNLNPDPVHHQDSKRMHTPGITSRTYSFEEITVFSLR
jgi:hypothetical protein